MPTSWTNRTPANTTWSGRLGGSYLLTKSGAYVTDILGRRIIVKVPGGSIPISLTSWSARNPV